MKSMSNQQQLIAQLHTPLHQAVFERLYSLLEPHAAQIASAFYDTFLKQPDAQSFLSHSLVNERLRPSLTRWIVELIQYRPYSEAQQEFIQQQKQIGLVHARINVPVQLVHEGMRLVRRAGLEYILAHSEHDNHTLTSLILLFNDLLDCSQMLIDDSYLYNHSLNEQSAESLRLNGLNQYLAVECEQLRSELFDWQRQVLTVLLQPSPQLTCPSIRHSPLWLWTLYKGDLLFGSHPNFGNLRRQLEVIDALCTQLDHQSLELHVHLNHLNEEVTRAAWLLSALINEIIHQEQNRDPLTRLLSRRYLPVVLQKQIEVSLTHGINFAVVLFDVDNFKHINDHYGHATGDIVLREVGETLLDSVRSVDPLFRYGGEEFLLVLCDVDEAQALSVANKIRERVEERRFRAGEQILHATISGGLAMFDRHPDYMEPIKRADTALYRAKAQGKNCVVLAERLSQG